MLTKKSLPPPQPPGPSQPPPMNLHNGSHNFKAKDPLFLRQENRAFLSLPNQINGVQTTGPQGCRCQSPSRGRARVGQGRASLQWDKMGRWEESQWDGDRLCSSGRGHVKPKRQWDRKQAQDGQAQRGRATPSTLGHPPVTSHP